MVEISSGKPYIDNDDIRTFSRNVDIKELVWHRDEELRKIIILEGEGWQFQFNGSLPFEMKKEQKFIIPMMMYHRLIRGKTDLVLKIEKHEI